jgi:hypothetical protein
MMSTIQYNTETSFVNQQRYFVYEYNKTLNILSKVRDDAF